MSEPSGWSAPRGRMSVFFPLLLIAASYLAWSVFQTVQFARDRAALLNVRDTQEKQIEESKKLRLNLDRLAKQTQTLADRGNKSALVIVDELRKRGITINKDSPPPGPPTGPGAPATK